MHDCSYAIKLETVSVLRQIILFSQALGYFLRLLAPLAALDLRIAANIGRRSNAGENPMDHDQAAADDFIHLAAEVAAAYVANNSLPAADLPELLKTIHQSLRNLAVAEAGAAMGLAVPQQKPVVPVSETLYPDRIVCLEDGQAFRSLKRHLGTAHQMTPQEYRLKWDLPSDYPMVAPNYAEARSEMAKKIGLGQRRPPVKKK